MENTDVDGETGKMKVSGGKYAVGHFELKADQYQVAWNTIYGKWRNGLPSSHSVGTPFAPDIP
ncbi:MAG: hypothetical protein WC364_11675 [Eubacteriales bacterium]|jgi:DNA gyrase inhibitor GyrI